MKIGIVTGREIKKNRDGDKNVLMLQCTMEEKEDVQSVELITQAGDDTNPPNGSAVMILEAGESYKIGIAVDDGIVPEVDEGDKKLYSIDAGVIKAFIKFLKNGDLELNGNADNAVRYSKLEEAFNQLKGDFDAFVDKYNPHIHVTTATIGASATPGVISATTSQGVKTTADISDAKIDEVLMP